MKKSNGSSVEMVEVESSNINSIGYSVPDQVLYVNFLSGQSYKYGGVPEDVYENFLNSDSKGKFLIAMIKGKYDYERL